MPSPRDLLPYPSAIASALSDATGGPAAASAASCVLLPLVVRLHQSPQHRLANIAAVVGEQAWDGRVNLTGQRIERLACPLVWARTARNNGLSSWNWSSA